MLSQIAFNRSLTMEKWIFSNLISSFVGAFIIFWGDMTMYFGVFQMLLKGFMAKKDVF